MDTGRLLNVIQDILYENENSTINDTLQQLLSNLNESINSNNTEVIEENLRTIKELAEKSIFFQNYSISKNKILEKIGANEIVGNGLSTKISDVLKSNFSRDQIDKLNQFIDSRNELIKKIRQIKNNLEELNFQADVQEDNFEIGILIPSKNELNTTKNINKILEDFNFLYEHLTELTEGEKKEIIVNNVGNSSLFFGFLASISIASGLNIILKILKCYREYLEIKKLRNELKEKGGLTKNEKNESEEVLKNLVEKKVEQIISELKNEFNREDKGRQNEICIGIKKGINRIVAHFEKGIQLEINPPHLKKEPQKLEEKQITNEDKENNTVSFNDGTKMTLDEYNEYKKNLEHNKDKLERFKKEKSIQKKIIENNKNFQNIKIENLNINQYIEVKEDKKNNNSNK